MERILLFRNGQEPLYVQIYTYFKEMIEQGILKQDDQLPSIRGLANNLGVSKGTVEMAYQQLFCEGYIHNANRARYRVAALEKCFFQDIARDIPTPRKLIEQISIKYDFASGEMDPEGFDFTLWKRYINRALMDTQRLVSYGHVQGEVELREQIVRYLHQSRGVKAYKHQIIIGPGVQSLLRLLCSLLRDSHQSIAFEDPGFKIGRKIFLDYGFQVIPIPMGQAGIDLRSLKSSGANLVYLSPSHQFPTGSIMSVGRRIKMLSWAERTNSLIIEDDYDSEFRYYGRPIPALKGLDQKNNVVYLGSFSKIIPPSIRISYMVLPEQLLAIYLARISLYKQAASTTEQLALALFMADGELGKQTRRLRKLYQEKRIVFFDSIREILGQNVILEEKDAGLFTIIKVRSNRSAQMLKDLALQYGCNIAALEDFSMFRNAPEDHPRLILYFSGLAKDKIRQGISLLHQAWFAKEGM